MNALIERFQDIKWPLMWLLSLMGLIVGFSLLPEVAEAGFVPLPSAESLGDIADPEGEGLQKGYNLVWKLSRNFRWIIGGVAMLFLMISGVKMVMQGDNEEVANKQKTNMLWGVIGLVLIMIAGPIAEILDLQDGGFLSDEYEISYRARLFDNQVHIILTFIKYIVGSVTVLFMFRSGAKMVLAGEAEDVISTERKNLMTNIFALFVIILSDTIVKQVLFKVSPVESNYSSQGQEAIVTFDIDRGVQEIVGVTNFVVSWAGPIAILALVAGAVMYVTAFGDEERSGKGKKIVINAVIALLVIYGAFALVSTVISGTF